MSPEGISDVLTYLSPRSGNAMVESTPRPSGQTEAELPRSSPISLLGSTDEALFAEISTGSKEALGVLFRRYRRAVLNVAKRILKDEPEAEDLCQEVFLLLFQRAKVFDATKGKASSWIIQIAYHRAMNRRQYLTHRQHYQPRELDAEQIGASGPRLVFDGIEAKTLLNHLRGQLTSDQEKTLELFFFEGYSLREIAERTNQSLGNVRHQYYRALERLRANAFSKKNG